MDETKITRFEVISDKGREIVEENCNVKLKIQDKGKTLKVFLERK